jgi:hypothetical protein
MPVSPAPTPRPARHEGFVLLVLLGVIGIGGVAVVFAVQKLAPASSGFAVRVQTDLATIAGAARDAFARNRAFPANLSALATTAGLPGFGTWRTDPWGAGLDYDYRVLASGVRVRSRGTDGRLNTADDVVLDATAEPALRAVQNARLRLLRAVHFAALQRAIDAVTGTPPSTRTELRAAARTLATSRRRWWFADATERSALTAAMAGADATITAAQAYAGWTVPTALTGSGGMCQRLGLPDSRAVDPRGRTLLLQRRIGFAARGYDGTANNNDDS